MISIRSLSHFAFAFAFIALTLCAAAPADSKLVETEVLRSDAVRIDALLKGDVKALERLFADDMVYVHSNGHIDTKKGYLSLLSGGSLVYVSLRYDPAPRVTVAGRDAAVVTGKATLEVKNKSGQVTQRVLTTTTVYVRVDDGWRVVSYQATPAQN